MEESLRTLLALHWYGNSLYEIATTVLLCLAVILCIRLFIEVILRRLRRIAMRTKIPVLLVVVDFISSIPFWMWAVLAIVTAAHVLTLPPLLQKILFGLLLACLIVLAVRLLQKISEYIIYRHVPHLRAGDGEALPSLVRFTVSVTLWVLGGLLLLSNLGINVLSLIAGLGIGGIAIALAVQNILGDIFSSFSLYFDQPFKEGDFIVVGAHSGTVKKIGLKTTRLQALQGEEVVISNHELTTVRVQNFKKMQKRRVEFRFTVQYGVPLEALKKVPDIVKSIIEPIEEVTFDRVHVKEFAVTGFLVECVYAVQRDDFLLYMNIQQRINFELLERFEKEGIPLAVPLQEVRIVSGSDTEGKKGDKALP